MEPDFDLLSHQELCDWAVANEITKIWSYDTQCTRDILNWRQHVGRLVKPGEGGL